MLEAFTHLFGFPRSLRISLIGSRIATWGGCGFSIILLGVFTEIPLLLLIVFLFFLLFMALWQERLLGLVYFLV